MIKRSILIFFCLMVYLFGYSQTENAVEKLTSFVSNLNVFADYVPQEKVYLHFDNTSYYIEDDIWFKCYLVTSAFNHSSTLSKTIYVELLTDDGNIIDTQILKAENGQAYGNFTLNKMLMQAGYYEIRAYTKYMLNFGDDCIFSRVFPVYDKPEIEGKFTQHMTIERKATQDNRPKEKNKNINISFFPEGGDLVNGIESRVAFIVTDKAGAQIEASGTVLNSENTEITKFSTHSQGRGIFSFVPNGKKHKAKIEYQGKSTTVDLPQSKENGFVLFADHSHKENIWVKVTTNNNAITNPIGLVTVTRDKLNAFNILDMSTNREFEINLPTKEYESGITRIIVFDVNGRILAERKIFIYNKEKRITIKQSQNKNTYQPYEKIKMDFEISDINNKPKETTFSLSVKDVDNYVYPLYDDNIMTNLLLSSDIKGHIENPSYYFQSDDAEHRKSLDLLMLTQGWTRYKWENMTGQALTNLQYEAEKGILIDGNVNSFLRKKARPNAELSVLLSNLDNPQDFLTGICYTDSLGNFKMYADIVGKWKAVLQTKEKNKKKDFNIILNSLFSPDLLPYSYSDISSNKNPVLENGLLADNNVTENNNAENDIVQDSLYMDQKIHHLSDVTITEKRKISTKEENLSASIVIYDSQKEMDKLIDSGEYIGEDIYDYLAMIDKNFRLQRNSNGDELFYKNRKIIFAIDDIAIYGGLYGEYLEQAPVGTTNKGTIRGSVSVSDIESIAISENPRVIADHIYTPPGKAILDNTSAYGSVVFLYTHPGNFSRRKRKGIRRTVIDGYSLTKEFYSPDYGILPPEPDYRRTLYWNPNVVTDSSGKASVTFYNNSTSKGMIISAETVTDDGSIGVLEKR